MEEWPSGLRRTPGKRVGVHAPRGFESPFLRHYSLKSNSNYLIFLNKINALDTFLCYYYSIKFH